ncbi:MAG: V-type ATP synthase subunit I [Candidatus Hydrogenedentota bacterium]
MISAMERIELVFLKGELAKMIPFLQDRGVVHIEDVPLALDGHPDYLHRIHLPEEGQKEYSFLERLQALLRESLSLLNPVPEEAEVRAAARTLDDSTGIEALRQEIEEANHGMRRLTRRRLNAQDNMELLGQYSNVLNILAPLLEDRDVQLGVTGKALLIPKRNAGIMKTIEKQLLRDVGPESGVITHGLDRLNLVAIVRFPEEQAAMTDMVLQEHGIVPLDVPDPELTGLPLSEAAQRAKAKMTRFKQDVENLRQELRRYCEENGARLHALDRVVCDRLSQLRVIEHFAQSKMVVVIHGWTPADQLDVLSSDLKETFGGRAVLGVLPKRGVDMHRIPTLLKNRPHLKPFQLILRMFDPPTYGTVDPTWIVAISFILFYGFILGDAGYGIFIITVAALVKRRLPHKEMVCDAMTIAQWMGASAIVFGLLYAEFFGNLPELYFGIHPLFHRMNEPLALLGVAIAFGAIHIPLGLLYGVVEGYRQGHREHAEERLGMLLGLAALAMALAGIVGVTPGGLAFALPVTGVLFAAAVFFLVRAMGSMFAMGLMEIIGLTSNILSYARLMALGLASVVLADLANMVLAMPGAWGMAAGIPLAGFVHLLNIGIGVFSPTIHSLRLNYVEFLPKFYEPEGRNYNPFRKELSW